MVAGGGPENQRQSKRHHSGTCGAGSPCAHALGCGTAPSWLGLTSPCDRVGRGLVEGDHLRMMSGRIQGCTEHHENSGSPIASCICRLVLSTLKNSSSQHLLQLEIFQLHSRCSRTHSCWKKSELCNTKRIWRPLTITTTHTGMQQHLCTTRVYTFIVKR